MTPKERAQQLIDDGYEQVSRKYRTLARLPPGKSGMECLREADPKLAQSFLDAAENNAKFMFLRCHNAEHVELSHAEFSAFLELTGRRAVPAEVIERLEEESEIA